MMTYGLQKRGKPKPHQFVLRALTIRSDGTHEKLTPSHARLARRASAHPGLHRFANFMPIRVTNLNMKDAVEDERSGRRRDGQLVCF